MGGQGEAMRVESVRVRESVHGDLWSVDLELSTCGCGRALSVRLSGDAQKRGDRPVAEAWHGTKHRRREVGRGGSTLADCLASVLAGVTRYRGCPDWAEGS